ncbi:hypothetical protein [Candidatus Hikarchaeum yamanae]|uniref:hypothetical protein n=1 Tax=Candidatus Hikarchaeum yamanae TaxID=2675326 RepID=UPI0039E7BB73|tara:strand:+ start:9637 stop:10017 length:381 start_codon:yes stop_codon:yes gene_type:complete
MEDINFIKLGIRIGKIALILGIVLSLLLVAVQITGTPEVQQRDMPGIEWDIERINSTHVSIKHILGEPIQVESVLITVEGRGRPIHKVDPIEQGDVIVTQAYEGTLVEIFWEQENEYLRLMHRSRV